MHCIRKDQSSVEVAIDFLTKVYMHFVNTHFLFIVIGPDSSDDSSFDELDLSASYFVQSDDEANPISTCPDSSDSSFDELALNASFFVSDDNLISYREALICDPFWENPPQRCPQIFLFCIPAVSMMTGDCILQV